MSTLDEKLAQDRPSTGRAQCWLRRHLTYDDGTPMFSVTESDKLGPVRVRVERRGKEAETWVRVGRRDGDWLMERES